MILWKKLIQSSCAKKLCLQLKPYNRSSYKITIYGKNFGHIYFTYIKYQEYANMASRHPKLMMEYFDINTWPYVTIL